MCGVDVVLEGKGLNMAAKILHSLTDDNLDLQKQIGCMNGILHLFDRHHVLTGERRVVGHGRKGTHHGKI